MVRRHGGQIDQLRKVSGCKVEDCVDLSASLNPLGPPTWTRELLTRHLYDLMHYPEEDACSLREAIAKNFNRPSTEVIAGNGSSELLFALPRILKPKRVLIPVPAYVDYEVAFTRENHRVVEVNCFDAEALVHNWEKLSMEVEDDDLVVLGNPINPTGGCMPELRKFIASHPNVKFLIDEAYADFVNEIERIAVNPPENAMILLSLTKSHAIAGLRIGALLASVEVIRELENQIPPWSVSRLAIEFGKKALDDQEYLDRTRSEITRLRGRFLERLPETFRVTESCSNFILAFHPKAEKVVEGLAIRGIAIRHCTNFSGLNKKFIRIAVSNERNQDALFSALEEMDL